MYFPYLSIPIKKWVYYSFYVCILEDEKKLIQAKESKSGAISEKYYPEGLQIWIFNL